MISDGDIHLFHKLLDSLSESLRQLATKYELLERQSSERDRAHVVMQGSLDRMIPDVSGIAAETKEVRKEITMVVSALDLLSKNATTTIENQKHIDLHLDAGEAVLSKISEQVKGVSGGVAGVAGNVAGVASSINRLSEEIRPVTDLSKMLKKPLVWILVIWTFISTSIAVSNAWEWIQKKSRSDADPSRPAASEAAKGMTPAPQK